MTAYQRAKLGYERPTQNLEAAYMHLESVESQNNGITDSKSEMKLKKEKKKKVFWRLTFISFSGFQAF